eukprot:COSAG02_NODE_21_length_53083_cov_95.733618_16_plen_103_part_00
MATTPRQASGSAAGGREITGSTLNIQELVRHRGRWYGTVLEYYLASREITGRMFEIQELVRHRDDRPPPVVQVSNMNGMFKKPDGWKQPDEELASRLVVATR